MTTFYVFKKSMINSAMKMNYTPQLNPIKICTILIIALSSLCIKTDAKVQAQTKPVQPTVEYVGNVAPFPNNTPKIIGGTILPWTNRGSNKKIQPIRQQFIVHNGTADDISVSVNGTNATIKVNSANPAKGTFVENTPIQITGPITIVYKNKKNGQTIKKYNTNDQAIEIINPYIFKVLPYQDGSHVPIDMVADSSNLQYGLDDEGHYRLFASVDTGTKHTRDISVWYVVTAPTGYHDYSGITVGIIQTMTEDSTLINYPLTNINDTTKSGSLQVIMSKKMNFPLWDGFDSSYKYEKNPELAAPCYYSKTCVSSTPGYVQGNNYISGNLFLTDAPSAGLPMIDIQGWHWGSYANLGNNQRSWDIGNGWTDDFQDMLSASSSDCPGVVIPIFGYKCWHVKFSGRLTETNMGGGTYIPEPWVGGWVNSPSSTTTDKPVTDIERGSANKWMNPPNISFKITLSK